MLIKPEYKKMAASLVKALNEGALNPQEELIARKILLTIRRELPLNQAKRIQFPKMEEYYLKYTLQCKCCNSFQSNWYFMKDTNMGYLRAELIDTPKEDPPPFKYSTKVDKIYTCSECKQVLSAKDISYLVERLIQSYCEKRGVK